jgi:hypothetical protein
MNSSDVRANTTGVMLQYMPTHRRRIVEHPPLNLLEVIL